MSDYKLIKLADQFELGSSCGNIARCLVNRCKNKVENYVLLNTNLLEFLCDEHFAEFFREVSYPTKREEFPNV